MPFNLNGTTLQDVLPVAQRIINYLDKLPFEELLTTRELARLINANPQGHAFRLTNAVLRPYGHYMTIGTGAGTQIVWGSKPTIKKLIQQLQENANAD